MPVVEGPHQSRSAQLRHAGSGSADQHRRIALDAFAKTFALLELKTSRAARCDSKLGDFYAAITMVRPRSSFAAQ